MKKYVSLSNWTVMKIISNVLIVLLFVGLLHPVAAQDNLVHFDSVPIYKPKRLKRLYQFNQPELTQIKIKTPLLIIHTEPLTPKIFFNDIVSDAVKELTNGFIHPTANRKAFFELRNKFDCDKPTFSWNLHLFLHGDYDSYEEDLTGDVAAYIDLAQGARGLIIENNDTIGYLVAEMDFDSTSFIYNAYNHVFNETFIPFKTQSNSKIYQNQVNSPYTDYAAFGKLRGNNFALIANGRTHKTFFYLNDELVFVFRQDIDDKTVFKSDRVLPYIMIKPKISKNELPDLFRMAVLSKYMSMQLTPQLF